MSLPSRSGGYPPSTGRAMDSVVKVESISPGVTFLDDGTLLGSEYPASPHGLKSKVHRSPVGDDTTKSDSRYTMGGAEFTFDGYDDETNAELEETASEAADTLYPLPDGWPKIPEIFVRRSWNFSTATCPSINKATAHLELLQNIIEDWSLETRNDILSRTSSRTAEITKSRITTASSEAESGTTGRRQIKFTPSAISSLGAGSRQPSARARSGASAAGRSATADLSIQGIGAQIDSNKGRQKPSAPVVEFEIPYLGAEDVIDEVITLLAKLEDDRRETKKNLKQEKERVEMLFTKIDTLSKQRLQALPEAVQNEHEACAMDINELNWHVSYRGRVEARIQNKVNIAEVLNSRLKEDIAYVKKHCPLVEEKLELEKEAMDRIKQAQSETNDELGQTTERCNKVTEKSVETHTKAEQERQTVKGDLDNVRDDLNSISEDLSEEKMKHNTYVHMCNDYRKQLEDNRQELLVLQVKNDNARSSEAMQAAKVRDLKGKIVEKEHEHRKLEDEIYNFKSRLESQRRTNSAKEQDMKLGIMKSEDKLRQLTRANKELEMDIEDHIEKIQDCDKQKIADEKNLVRMAKELERTKESMKLTEEDLFKVRTINRAVKDKLHAIEDRALMEEEGLKARAEALRKQVKEEIHSKTVIQARIQSDNSDLIKDQAETKVKKEKVSKKVEEVDLVVKSILEKVVKLRSAHEERSKTIRELTGDIEKLERERTSLLESVAEKLGVLEPKHKQIKDELLALDKRMDHMEWKTDMMNKNMEEMISSSKIMTRSMAKTQVIIDQLQDESDDLTIKIRAGQHLHDQLQSQLNQTTGRIKDNGKQHRQLMEERQKVLTQHKNDLGINLKLNKELASKYRQLQNQYVALKNDMLNHLDGRVQAETSVKDLKKVQGLQKRMHAALNIYYKLRGLYNRAELARMEVESSENTRKVGELKEDIDAALSGISKFIQTQMDGTVARQMALKKVQIQEEEQGSVDIGQVQLDLTTVQQSPLNSATSNTGVISVHS